MHRKIKAKTIRQAPASTLPLNTLPPAFIIKAAFSLIGTKAKLS